MPTECSPTLFEFARVEGRAVVASFDGGRITSDAGALLLGATDRVIGLTHRLAACFTDARNPAYVEHEVGTLVMQRIVGIALGYDVRFIDIVSPDLAGCGLDGQRLRVAHNPTTSSSASVKDLLC